MLLFASVSLFQSAPASAAVSEGVGVTTNNLLMYFDLANYSGFSSPTLTDLSGNGYNFTTATAGSGSLPTKTGSNGNYLNFTGSGTANGGYLSLASLPTGSSAWSGLSVSFYANMGTATLVERVFDFGNAAQSDNIWVGVGSFNEMAIEVFNGSASPGWCRSAQNAIVNNEWAHWTVVLDGSTCKWYKNNVLSSSNNYSYLPQRNLTLTRNYIGKSNWVDPYFEGGIGDIAIYKGVLSDSDRLKNFNAQTDLTAPTLSTVTLSSPENRTTVETLTASEPSTFTITSGGDSSLFNMSTSGAISFKDAPNFESAADADRNNQYLLSIRVVDANGNTSSGIIYITVTNIAEVATLSIPTLSGTPYKGVSVTITVTPSAGNTAGKLNFMIANKRIPGCYKKNYSGTGNVTCTFNPAITGYREIAISFTPNGVEYSGANVVKTFFFSKRITSR